ncbi:hypothetical protein PPACK8108_LOCUS24208 [Phakopsora pachyrhizi]|uniref:Uncharacterized protein n=1 Tax=Phakopsora pachyrhizi TaxID=170000 RepID=A0AAV0BR40_PHAPC|nr:hypothetical protein PPACK8108_LOCUS24208 [Phakopsora pachyrhizi]
MHHQPQNQERAINLSILTVSGPGEFPRFVLHQSKNFTSDNVIQMPPTDPINHYGNPRNQQNRITLKCIEVHQERPKFDYELFNVNNFNIRYWSWNYRGCWHQTCPPIDPRPLSGIEPLFPVTRHHHGRPLSYHRKLIGQIFE